MSRPRRLAVERARLACLFPRSFTVPPGMGVAATQSEGSPRKRCRRWRMPGGQTAPGKKNFEAREKQAWEKGVQRGRGARRARRSGACAAAGSGGAGSAGICARTAKLFPATWKAKWFRWRWRWCARFCDRESQVDPLLLTGLVRVALEKMAGSQTCDCARILPDSRRGANIFARQHRIPPSAGSIGRSGAGAKRVPDETELGSPELNLETQLKEIEQGLFDLLAQRPASDK